jgi:hypothetical protein
VALLAQVFFKILEQLFHNVSIISFPKRNISLRPDFVRVLVRKIFQCLVIRPLVYLELVSLVLLAAFVESFTIVEAGSNGFVVVARLGWGSPRARCSLSVYYLLYARIALEDSLLKALE